MWCHSFRLEIFLHNMLENISVLHTGSLNLLLLYLGLITPSCRGCRGQSVVAFKDVLDIGVGSVSLYSYEVMVWFTNSVCTVVRARCDKRVDAHMYVCMLLNPKVLQLPAMEDN